ncbi:chromosome segregation ATPase [Paraburkholderia bannensis]|uniref:Chromosome segregation ATPase n=1 Tax=Paraburkholderia bannensis TaxID=765414 RepID=A0A7W9TWZ4_9BURK|nr:MULTISPECIES: DUF1090 family protein [Paraburkholderia]MBB3257831.1 chromosome segregation ATPase [Paraburkholderia sp. WP4_3_2]MBB6102844.1 chromosome segregation ATPase [Paraburkholderia bannensis]
MKKPVIAAAIALVAISTNAFARYQDCDARINAIKTKIQIAKQWGNVGQAASLESELSAAKAECAGPAQAARAERDVAQQQEDVRRAQADVDEASDRLRDAQSRGDTQRIAQAERRLADKQDRLREKIDDLHRAQAALKG